MALRNGGSVPLPRICGPSLPLTMSCTHVLEYLACLQPGDPKLLYVVKARNWFFKVLKIAGGFGFQEVIRIARDMESIRKLTESMAPRPVAVKQPKPASDRQASKPQSVTCFKCGKPGHVQLKCPNAT